MKPLIDHFIQRLDEYAGGHHDISSEIVAYRLARNYH